MDFSLENTGGLGRRLKVQVPAADVEREVEQRLRSFGKRAKLKGYRPGKVPHKVIRQKYGGQVRREVLGDLVQSTFSEAIAKEKVSPAGGPKIEPSSMDEGKDLEYTAEFEIYPEITLQKTAGLKIERPAAEIAESDVDDVIENLREQRAEWHSVDRKARAGDRVVVDFTGRLDGEIMEGGTGEAVPVIIGEGRMVKDFESGVTGIRSGEERAFKVRFPKDYKENSLAGKKCQFTVTAHSVEEKVLPEVDDEFCVAFGVDEGGVARLREDVRKNMEQEMQTRVKEELRKRLLDQFLQANPVEVPSTLVDEEVRTMQEDSLRRLGIEDMSRLPPADPFLEPARRRVSLGLLVGKFIEEQKLRPDAHRATERLRELAGQYENADEIFRVYQGNAQMRQRVEMMVLEEQVVERLLEAANVSDRKMSFRKLMDLDRAAAG